MMNIYLHYYIFGNQMFAEIFEIETFSIVAQYSAERGKTVLAH